MQPAGEDKQKRRRDKATHQHGILSTIALLTHRILRLCCPGTGNILSQSEIDVIGKCAQRVADTDADSSYRALHWTPLK
jgi:hypothetical protein